MKKKIIMLGLGFFLVLFIALLCYKWRSDSKKDDRELISQIFGITESQYTIVDVKNALSKDKYDGRYIVTINVEVDKMDDFLLEVNKGFYLEEWSEGYRVIMKKYIDRELGERDIFYHRLGPVKRKVIDRAPKTCASYIVYSDAVENNYEVIMIYSE